jgi:predicted O-linked N-acetylglucosamine transferase (SPINDLY family)
VYITLVEKSAGGLKLRVYSESLALVDSNSFNDSHTLNFHLQALARRQGIAKSLLVIHDKDKNEVDLFLAHDENLFFVS